MLASILPMSLAVPMMGTMGWWGHDGGMVAVAPWWGLGMGLGWLAVLGLVGYEVYRAFVRRDGVGTEAGRAMEALRLAYARGELTDEAGRVPPDNPDRRPAWRGVIDPPLRNH